MTTAPSNISKITIHAQHFDGNDPEGFDAAAWLEALTAEYLSIAAAHFPGVAVAVDIDRQLRSSGYTRPVSVDFTDDDPEMYPDFAARDALQTALEYATNDLYDQRGEEFYMGDRP